jgi:hypothetical protein
LTIVASLSVDDAVALGDPWLPLVGRWLPLVAVGQWLQWLRWLPLVGRRLPLVAAIGQWLPIVAACGRWSPLVATPLVAGGLPDCRTSADGYRLLADDCRLFAVVDR